MAWMVVAITLASTAFLGGWEWTAVSLLALLVVWQTDFRATSVLAAVAPGFCWLALYCWTGDRRLFFPYAMQYAAQSGSVVLLFVLIRLLQSASAGVLLVEILVASGILALTSGMQRKGRSGLVERMLGAALGSVLAFAGLSL
jgi:hypothetical protein